MRVWGRNCQFVILWMDEILHHLEAMGNHCWLVFTGEPSFQGFLGGAGFRPTAVEVIGIASSFVVVLGPIPLFVKKKQASFQQSWKWIGGPFQYDDSASLFDHLI